MSAGIRGAGDSVADRLKNFSFAQVGNDQSEQQASAAMRYAAHIGSRTGNSIDEATLLKFAQCMAHRDSRRFKSSHQRRLAGKLLPRPVAAAHKIAAQLFKDYLMLRLGIPCTSHSSAVISD